MSGSSTLLALDMHLIIVCQSHLKYSAVTFLLMLIARKVAVISKSLVNLEPGYDHGTDAVLIPCSLRMAEQFDHNAT